MKLPGLLFLLCLLRLHSQAEGQALYFRNDILDPEKLTELDAGEETEEARKVRQSQTDFTVKAILEWLQGRSNQPGRKARDSTGSQSQPARQYLPVPEVDISTHRPTERPRPFQPNPTPTPQPTRPPYSSPSPQPTNPQYSSTNPSPQQPSGYPYQPSPQPPFGLPSSSERPYQPTDRPYQPTDRPYQPTDRPYQPSEQPYQPSEGPYSTPTPSELPPFISSAQPTFATGGEVEGVGGGPSINVRPSPDEAHPPHIHAIDVQCAKDQMTINIEFNRVFNGVIYSKGFYRQDACRYVNENSGQSRYSFTVRLDSCGTQFIDQFKEGGQAYLENVLVLQNEPGIQEVWDTIRRVRCLWEGNINKALSVNLNVDMLSQEIVTFSGDTAVARLDIQLGRGPFAPAANGLVKIGETMTLVVSVEGDPGFDVQVRDCIARDSTSHNVVRLTDERGCILRPKLMGAFQKTRETGNSPASIIAYAFFQAFKFPDVMDLTLECNVELCKTDCEACPEPGQNKEPVLRRKRDLWVDNSTLGDPVRVYRSFRVISPDDFIDEAAGATIINLGSGMDGLCMSVPGFLLVAVLLLSVLIGSCLLSAYLWLKQYRATKSPIMAKTIRLDTFPVSKA